MRRLEDFMNALTDMDWGWWPVVSFRPPKDGEIDNRVLLKISPIFGSAAGFLILVIRVLERRAAVTPASVIVHLLIGIVGFFVVFKFTFAYFWNRRAKRLRNSQTRATGNENGSAI
jgi:hypothetical protein